MTGPKKFFDQVREVMVNQGYSSLGETLRMGFSRFYTAIYRREQYGYQSGLKTSGDRIGGIEKRHQIAEIEQKLTDLEPTEATKLLEEIGYINVALNNAENIAERIVKNDVGLKFFRSYYPGGYSDRFNLDELKADVRKYLKKSAKNHDVSETDSSSSAGEPTI